MRQLFTTLAASLFTMGTAFAAPSYMPTGAQANVALATVTAGGWTQCYQATMATTIGNAGENVLNACQGDLIMMAGRATGSQTLLALAATNRADSIIDTGDSTTNTHISNGAQWWYSDNWSWGFASLADTVRNFECGQASLGMCLHTLSFVGGYSINNNDGLNGSTDYEKLFFVADANAVPEPGALALVSLALLGAAAARRRKAG